MIDSAMDSSDDIGLQILKKLTPEQKLRAAERLYWSAWQLKAAGVRAQNPHWTEKEVQEAVRSIFLHARS